MKNVEHENLIKISLLNFNHVYPENQPINLDMRVYYVHIVKLGARSGVLWGLISWKYDATEAH